MNTLDNRTDLSYQSIWYFGAIFAFLNNYIESRMFVSTRKGIKNGK